MYDEKEWPMSKLLRYYADGQIYFVTCVTADRAPILIDHMQLFYDAVRTVRHRLVFRIGPYAILPNHLHWIIDPRDSDLSDIMHRIKVSFSMKIRFQSRFVGPVWQKRFWDHLIRDEDDFNVHADYIHYNPIKHGLTAKANEWPDSSFLRYSGDAQPAPNLDKVEAADFEGDFGE